MSTFRRASDLPFSELVPRALLAFVVASVLAVVVSPPAHACKGFAPPPFCAKSLVLAQAAPPFQLLPGGGTFDIPVTVYFGMGVFPAPASGLCPSGPYAVDVSLTVTCSPSADGSGSLVGAPIAFGYTDLLVPVTLPAGPPRLCEVAGVATVTLSDGMVITATSDSLVCVADPAPGAPTVPRLDMIMFGDPGDEIQKAHPGDQNMYTYRIFNNDPVETYTGTLAVESVNTSRLPGMSGPQPPGTGVFPISDPGLGDNFPISLGPDLINGCVPLPLDPSLPIVPTLLEPLVIPPASFVDVDLFSRSWGMCADGSCSRAKMVVDGSFSDASAGLACSGFVHAADTSLPPQYLWPDSGQVAQFPIPPNPALGLLTFMGQPLPEVPVQIDAQMQPPQLLLGGLPSPVPPQIQAGTFWPELGRIDTLWQDPAGLMPLGDPLGIQMHLDLLPPPGSPLQLHLQAMQLVPEAPMGFEATDPFGMGRLGIELPGGGPGFDAYLELTLQVSGIGTDDVGVQRDVVFDVVDMALTGDGQGIDVILMGTVPPGSFATGTDASDGITSEGPGGTVNALQFSVDLTGFFSEGLPITVFEDGFESGGTEAWTRAVTGTP